MNYPQILAVAQGAYFALTGLWPLVHVRSFMAVTGPKTDVWLVRTVGVVILCIGVVLTLAGARDRMTFELVLLAVLSAAGLAAVDVVYVLRRVIDKIYLADAAVELVLIALWSPVLLRR